LFFRLCQLTRGKDGTAQGGKPVKEREVMRYLEYLGLEPLHPSKGIVVKASSRKAKTAKIRKKQTKS
jgi:hypothetical protein